MSKASTLKAVPAPDPDEEPLIAKMSCLAEREIFEIQAIGWAIDALTFSGMGPDLTISDLEFVSRLGCLGSAISKKAGAIAKVMETYREDR